MKESLPLLPTSVIGSHGLPGWLWLAREALEARRLGPTDVKEVMEDATQLALLDQERAGVDVSEGRLTEAGAREKLIKARVDVHAFNAQRVEETVGEGMKITAEVQAAGNEALAELAFRRKGLGLSLLAIGFVVLSLWLLIRHLERPQNQAPKA